MTDAHASYSQRLISSQRDESAGYRNSYSLGRLENLPSSQASNPRKRLVRRTPATVVWSSGPVVLRPVAIAAAAAAAQCELAGRRDASSKPCIASHNTNGLAYLRAICSQLPFCPVNTALCLPSRGRGR